MYKSLTSFLIITYKLHVRLSYPDSFGLIVLSLLLLIGLSRLLVYFLLLHYDHFLNNFSLSFVVKPLVS